MSRRRARSAILSAVASAGLVAGLAGCVMHPPRGTGGAAETAGADGWPPPAYWTGEPLHPELRAEALPDGTDLGEAWIAQRLATMSCLDFRLESLGTAGASEAFPAELALARADRRRALRALRGGLPQDGALHLQDYRARVDRIEAALMRVGRPVAADLRGPRC